MTILTSTATVSGLLPSDYGQLLIEPLERDSIAFNPAVSTVISTSSVEFRMPIVTEDAGAAWLTEGEDITPDDATFDEAVVIPAKVGGLSKISRELADDSTPAAAQIVGDSIARSIAVQVDSAFAGDLAAPAPSGLEAVVGVSTVDAGAAWSSIDAFAEALSKAEAAGATVTAFITSPEVALELAKLKTATGSNQPLLGTDATNGTQRQILGVPVIVSAAVSADTVWAVDASRIVTVLRDDVRIERSTDAFFASDTVGIKATARVGFVFASPASIVKITVTAA